MESGYDDIFQETSFEPRDLNPVLDNRATYFSGSDGTEQHAVPDENARIIPNQDKTGVFQYKTGLSHTPHSLFIELDELVGREWVEKARWIKYEEDLEQDADRWGNAHVSALTVRSLIKLRNSFENGVVLLDVEADNLTEVVDSVVDALKNHGIIEGDNKMLEITRMFNWRHKYVDEENGNFKKKLNKPEEKPSKKSMLEEPPDRTHAVLSCLGEDTEAALCMVGAFKHPRTIAAFVRLAEAEVMHGKLEMAVPVRFLYFLLVPPDQYMLDHFQMGRTICTLMANDEFQTTCYGFQTKREILDGINDFLDDSLLLPPGNYNKQKLLSIQDIMEIRNRRQNRKNAAIDAGIQEPETKPHKETAQEIKQAKEDKDKEEKPIRNPLIRSKRPFGGLIDDIRCRYPQYLSDIMDGLNPQCLAAIIFIYFAALSGAIAFGGLMGAKTNGDIGIPETLIISSVTGVIFSLLAGCPLIIIGTTGPVLLYDEALYGFSGSMEIEFLSWRTWIGIWTLVIALIVAAFEGSTLVKHFTKFTKDIFAALVALLFIFEALRKLYKIFVSHPLVSTEFYCDSPDQKGTISVLTNVTEAASLAQNNEANPNTALLSAILMFGTFWIAYFLRGFRTSKVFGRNVRKALGDFGVPIGIVIMVLIDIYFDETYTEKLAVPEGLQVTNSTKRGWFIPPTGVETTLPIWSMFAGFLPAILLYLLLFMETHICELIMLEKTKGEKGVGIHLDIVLLSAINTLSSLFGGPWICAATVRAVSHASALVIVSANAVPGESPRIVGVRDQRLSAFVVSVLLGLSVLLAPVLKMVPFAVLFGVFLYMGVSGMNGVQFFDRLKLLIMPVKHHPQVSYVKHVKTWRMLLFTGFQLLGLVILWVVKSTPAAIAFPFFVIGMIPLRFSLNYIFTEQELDALDGPQAGKDLSGTKDEDIDFLDAATDVPIVPHSAIPLHRSILGIINIPGVALNQAP